MLGQPWLSLPPKKRRPCRRDGFERHCFGPPLRQKLEPLLLKATAIWPSQINHTRGSERKAHEFSMWPLMGPLKYDGIFVCRCEWSPATFNVREQSCLKAHGANTGFTAVLQWAFLLGHHSASDSKDSHWETNGTSYFNIPVLQLASWTTQTFYHQSSCSSS